MALHVAISGPRHCTQADADNARRVGELLGQRGAIVFCGGRDLGVMGAVAAGVRSVGGICVGILPGHDRQGASPDLTVTIPTDIGEARNNVLVLSGDALIVIGGSWGTLSEMALGMRRGDIPVIVLGGWKLFDQNDQAVPGLHEAASPEEAVELAFRLAELKQGPGNTG